MTSATELLPRTTVAAAFSAAIAFSPALLAAQEEEADGSGRANELIGQIEATLASAQTVQFDERTVMRIPELGNMEMVQGRMSLAAERPNRLRVELYEGDDESPALVVVSDGETLSQHFGGDGPEGPLSIYEQGEAPGELAAIIDGSPFLGAPSISLFAPAGSFAEAFGADTEFDYHGVEEDEDGVEYQHLGFSVPGTMSGEMTATTGEKPLLRSIRITEMQGREMNLAFLQENWRLDEEIPASRFEFDPPEDAELVASVLDELILAQGGGPHSSVGQPAPDFELEMLDSEESITLAAHKGQDVIVLDFWATWCGPCREIMPTIEKVAGDYADKNVAVYAVNLREAASQARSFLEAHELTLPVLMDRDGAVSQRYGVMAIPHTAIVGKDGTIQAVHVGASPGLEDRLRNELDTLLAGELLVEPEETAEAEVEDAIPDVLDPVD